MVVGVEILVMVAATVIVLKFTLAASFSADVPADLVGLMFCVLTGIKVFTDVNANTFEVVTALSFTV